MDQHSVQINAAVHAYNLLLLVKRAIKGKLHKRGKLKTGWSCMTVIQDEKRVSVEAIKQISGASKVERYSQDHRTIKNVFLKNFKLDKMSFWTSVQQAWFLWVSELGIWEDYQPNN